MPNHKKGPKSPSQKIVQSVYIIYTIVQEIKKLLE